MPPGHDAIIRAAIAGRRLLRFRLRGALRIAEPHDYGVRNGAVQLLTYQVGGESRSGGLPNWRWVMVEEASDFEILEQTFSGGRGRATMKHTQWDRLFARVLPA